MGEAQVAQVAQGGRVARGAWRRGGALLDRVRGRPGGTPAAASDPRDLALQCLAEVVGTAVLLLVGLSVVIFDLGTGSPLAAVVPSMAARRAITGTLFGTTGMLIALSPVGRISGAHINPVVSLTFWYERSLRGRALVLYVLSQLLGAIIGCVPLLAWGAMGRSIGYASTQPQPGPGGVGLAFAGEVTTTFCLVAVLVTFVGTARLRRWTPGIFPPLYGVMVWLEAPWSGTSTNPARSLGPDVVGLAWHACWLYWAAPVAGTAVALAARRWLPLARDLEIDVARVARFGEPFGRRRSG